MEKIRMIVASRHSQQQFITESATGRTVRYTTYPNLKLSITPDNRRGLPSVYNQAILETEEDPAILVFAHDDLHFTDFFWCHRLLEALDHFQIVGLAGNKRRIDQQPGWAFINTQLTWDDQTNLSGVVAHGKGFPPNNLSNFGPSRQQVKLLDGLFLAVRSETLWQHNLMFDEQFDFHFYDMDFCRQAEVASLICGTWDIALIHESGGNFNSPAWRAGYQTYLQKWGN